GVGRYRLGIDIGGTFTDFSLLDEVTGELSSFKSPTVPDDPGRGVLDGLRALVTERGFDLQAIDYLVHGTTIAINTVIQRNGASLGLLVTAGFGDLLEIQRLRLASPVNFTATRPLPLIPRYRVGEVTERILSDGTVDTALDREELLREATRLVEREGAEALVVSFGNAYRTPAHEAEARKVLAERFPGLHVTCSHEVRPVYSTDETVGDFPIVMPVVGVSSIGAGGGSIAWLDPVGVLKVGPRSAGADPGPACYGRGATEPALSDAFLLCGFLNPDNF